MCLCLITNFIACYTKILYAIIFIIIYYYTVFFSTIIILYNTSAHLFYILIVLIVKVLCNSYYSFKELILILFACYN